MRTLSLPLCTGICKNLKTLVLHLNKVTKIVISSVVPIKTKEYHLQCNQLLDIDPFIVKHNNIDGLLLNVENPASVGADRICNVMGAKKKFKTPIIILSFECTISRVPIRSGKKQSGQPSCETLPIPNRPKPPE